VAWFVRTMRGVDTTIRIDKPVSSLVQNGPFRYSRNPGYVALAMIYTGIAVLRNALWAILLLPLVVSGVIDLIDRVRTRRQPARVR
jgi:protein-S-isoprenylcysteine O-methyltransferase Ste14